MARVNAEGRNKEIRRSLLDHDVSLWVLAENLGISSTWLTVKMRQELPEEEKKKWLALIEKIAAERSA